MEQNDLYDAKQLEDAIRKARNSLTTDRLDMSYGEIISMYERGDIIISPEFQRLFRWSDYQKTRFIESILLGIPTPPIFVAEDKEGRWELVDGLQRISTILSFFGILKDYKEKNNWVMVPGDLVQELNGYKNDILPQIFNRNIRRAYCRVEIIKWDSKYDMRYELFNRLNTGGSPLTEQEIRNCIFRGKSNKFNELLEQLSEDGGFIKILNIKEEKKQELYLEELVLRFFAVYNNKWDKYKIKNMSSYMTEYMKDAIESDNFNYQDKDIFFRTVNVLKNLDNSIFRFNNNQFSTSLYDAIMVGIAKNIDGYEKKNKEFIEKKINLLKKDSKFRQYTGAASSSKSRVIKRMARAMEIFKI
jgi:hypothetical protein